VYVFVILGFFWVVFFDSVPECVPDDQSNKNTKSGLSKAEKYPFFLMLSCISTESFREVH
jgi:hypothetical protein